MDSDLLNYAAADFRRSCEEVHGKNAPVRRPPDPLLYDPTKPAQDAIDRARTQATAAMRRAMSELRRLQNERLFRAATMPGATNMPGLATYKELLPTLDEAAKSNL